MRWRRAYFWKKKFCPQGNKAGKVTAHRNENETADTPCLICQCLLICISQFHIPLHITSRFPTYLNTLKKDKTCSSGFRSRGMNSSSSLSEVKLRRLSSRDPIFPCGHNKISLAGKGIQVAYFGL